MWVQNIAAAIVVFELTGSASAVGFVSVMQFGAEFFIAPWAGSMSDRFDRRRLLITGQLIQLVSTGVLTAWVLLAGVDGLPGPWPIYLTTLGLGIGAAISGPAGRALVPALVDPVDLDAAVALNSVPYTIARAVGPALGAGLVLAFGPAAAFGVNAATYGIFALVLVFVRPRPLQASAVADRSVRAGLGYVLRDRYVRRLLAGVAGVAFAVDPVITLMPAFAAQLGGDAGLVGMLASAFGIGAVVAIFLVPALRRRLGIQRLSVAGLSTIALAMLALSVTTSQLLALGFLVVGGAGFFTANATLATQVQRWVPEHLRGRVMALWGVAFLGSRPIAAMVNGMLADLVSTRVAIATAATVAVLSALLVRGARTVVPAAEGDRSPATAERIVSTEQT